MKFKIARCPKCTHYKKFEVLQEKGVIITNEFANKPMSGVTVNVVVSDTEDVEPELDDDDEEDEDFFDDEEEYETVEVTDFNKDEELQDAGF